MSDITAHLLTVKWPDGVDPRSLTDFETQARILRYQALGRACRSHQTSALLTAHHENDQAETILLRLAKDHTVTGLKGMSAEANIPECHGMYGVHESGSPLKTNRGKQAQKMKSNWRFLTVEGGSGIKLLRPLLDFSKERLIATCKESSTTWFEDPTNQDKALTDRNAVRHLLQGKRLPRALSTDSLVSLGRHCRRWLEIRKQNSEKLFNRCKLKLDICSGLLEVRFPELDLSNAPGSSEAQILERKRLKYEALLLIRRVVELVSPLSNVQLSHLRWPLKSIYPEFEVSGTGKAHSLTSCGVMFSLRSEDDKDNSTTYDGLQSSYWVLHRQPVDRDRNSAPHPTVRLFPRKRLPPLQDLSTADDQPPSYEGTRWQLWDGRYWVRAGSNLRDTIKYTVQAFSEADREYLRGKGYSDMKQRISWILRTAASAKVRWTLPALLDEKDKLVELPTLGITCIRPYRLWFDADRCDIRYKKIDLGAHNREQVIVNGRLAADETWRVLWLNLTKKRFRQFRKASQW
jgi:tRNA(Ile)-lysidine synthase